MGSKSINGASGITASTPLIAGNSIGLGGGGGSLVGSRYEGTFLNVERMALKPNNGAGGIKGSAPLIAGSSTDLRGGGAGSGRGRLSTLGSVASLDSGAASDVVGLDFAPVLALAGVIRVSDEASGAIIPNRMFNPTREP